MKKVLFILFLMTGITFNNCTNCDFPDVPSFFDVKGFKITQLIQNGVFTKPLKPNESLDFHDYFGFKINLLVDYISYIKTKPQIDFSFIQTLNACSPPIPGEYGSKTEKIDSIKVITIFPFDSSHPSGAVMNDLLFIGNFMFLDSFIQTNRNQLIPYEEIELKMKGGQQDPFNIKQGYFQLKAMIVLSNGEYYESFSDTLRFF